MTENRPDLDALEKLAESLATLDSEERDWPLVKIHGRVFHVENAAKAASDGLTALIAELREARGLLKPFAVYYEINDLDERLADDTIEVPVGDLRLARAFLARNGKGEGQ